MSGEAARPALSMTLPELVAVYKSRAVKFGEPVPIGDFGLSPEEAARVFSAYDEDYHISRFFHFTQQHGLAISINGVLASHVAIDPKVESIL